MVCGSNPNLLINMIACAVNITVFIIFFVFYIHFEDVITVFINSITYINLTFLWIFLELMDVKALHHEEDMASPLYDTSLSVIKCSRCRTIHCEYMLIILTIFSLIGFIVNTIINLINGKDDPYFVWDVLFFIFTVITSGIVVRKAFLKNKEYNEYVGEI